jgi:SAM-dependent methyltransferase
VTEPGGAPAGLPLEHSPCPVCGEDDGEPVAVGADFDLATSTDGFLALECRVCAAVYLNPAPAAAARTRIYPAAYFAGDESERRRTARQTARRALACCEGLPATARLLEVAYGRSVHVGEIRDCGAPSGWSFEVVTPHALQAEAARRLGVVTHVGSAADLSHESAYDVVLMLHALEHCGAPVRELRAVRALLRPGGRVVIVCQNAESAVRRRFQGRHWAGYDFPRHRALYGPRALRAAADRAGFAIERLQPVRCARMWNRSAAALLGDWTAPAWLEGQARWGAVLATPMAAVAEVTAGRGLRAGWIEAVLRLAPVPR